MPPSKVELYAAIRRDVRAGMSIREVQRKHGVGFRTVKQALASAWPEPRKKLPPRPTRLDAYKPVIDAMLREDLDAPRGAVWAAIQTAPHQGSVLLKLSRAAN